MSPRAVPFSGGIESEIIPMTSEQAPQKESIRAQPLGRYALRTFLMGLIAALLFFALIALFANEGFSQDPGGTILIFLGAGGVTAFGYAAFNLILASISSVDISGETLTITYRTGGRRNQFAVLEIKRVSMKKARVAERVVIETIEGKRYSIWENGFTVEDWMALRDKLLVLRKPPSIDVAS